jgi:hypothetical protein
LTKTSHSFVWIPGHSNIKGNETAAKVATNLQMPSDLKMKTCDLKSKIKKESLATWKNQWEQTTSHMLNIKRTTKRWESIKVFNQRAQVVINRMRIGYTHLTHSVHHFHSLKLLIIYLNIGNLSKFNFGLLTRSQFKTMQN